MGTDIRPEISENNKYFVSKHRYYELKHYCLQYQEFKKSYNEAKTLKSTSVVKIKQSYHLNDPTIDTAVKQVNLYQKISLIEKIAKEADPIIGEYILKAVTTGVSYTYLKMNDNIPCGKDLYYDRYRRFFWLLDKHKD